MRGRKRKNRYIDADHSGVCFKPCGVQKAGLQTVVLYEDEMEAVRLADFEGLYQQECSDRMGISRTTFSRLIESARKKISDALVNGKALVIKMNGGNGHHSPDSYDNK
ncbi:MAG: hypothetical protein B5M52_08335 [Helicobacteraceae bacterium 4484_230]|nr:MAG: hypothetical protein B5M52_08335 [Helicobacteraceae bacterium 4484_230]